MVKGLIIPAEGSAPAVERDFEQLEDYQAAVGGWIEPVDIPDLGVTMYVNENGIAERHEPNLRATFFWWFHVPAARQSAMLVGDAVIVGEPDRDGASTDVPNEVAELLNSKARFAIEIRLTPTGDWSRLERTDEYLDAVVWAMLLAERSEGQLEVRVRPERRP